LLKRARLDAALLLKRAGLDVTLFALFALFRKEGGSAEPGDLKNGENS